MEKTFSFGTLKRRLESISARTGMISVSDVANSFFLVRFSYDLDYQRASFGGPYRLAVTRIGNCIERTVKLDLARLEGARARYARVCVEVDLSKPLLGKYLLEDKTYYIECESLENICFSCGIYGHKLDACVPPTIPAQEGVSTEKDMNPPEAQDDEKVTGEWMTVTQKYRGRPKKDPKGPTQNSSSGSRFQILQRNSSVSPGEPTRIKSSSDVSDIDSIIAEHAAQLSQILKKAGQPEGSPADDKADPAKSPKGRKPLADMTNTTVPQPPATSRGGGPARKEGAEGELFSVPVTYNNPVFQGVADRSIKTKVSKPIKKNEKKGSSMSVRSVEKLKHTTKGAGKPTCSFVSKKPQVGVETESVSKTGKPPDQA
ncbi:hypothetical protein LINPERHAP1_LOCUS36675 [Linum perenne]